MVLMGILGELGSGKTLALTYLALRNYSLKQRTIYSNYNLKFPHIHVKTPDDVLGMKDGFAALDEKHRKFSYPLSMFINCG